MNDLELNLPFTLTAENVNELKAAHPQWKNAYDAVCRRVFKEAIEENNGAWKDFQALMLKVVTREERVNSAIADMVAESGLETVEAIRIYSRESYRQFVSDMLDAGMENDLRHYRGRNFYSGPAISTGANRRAKDIMTVSGATRIPLQHDSLGHDYVVYPMR